MTAELLLHHHVARRLARFGGSIYTFLECLHAGEIPLQKDDLVAASLAAFQADLRETGTPEEDDLLLRYGLLEGSAQVTRLRAALDFGRTIFPQLSAETDAALLELFQLIQSAHPSDGDWVRAHTDLPQNELDRLIQFTFFTLTHLNAANPLQQDVAIDILSSLAQFRMEGLGRVTELLLERDILWPPVLYREAPANVAAQLIERIIRAPDRPTFVSNILALAWTRGDAARKAFRHWRDSPP